MYAIPDEIDGWAIIERNSDYNFVYIGFYTFILIQFLFGVPPHLPSPPDIIYRLENKNSGVRRTVTLSGNHKREDLVAAIADLK